MEASSTLPNRVLGAVRDAGVFSIAVLVLGVLGGVALIVVAIVVVAFVVLRDLPKANETGLVGIRYEQAEAGVDAGLYLAVLGAALCAAAGSLRLVPRFAERE